ncbi:MAG: transcription-repair coupling factor, partial [Planctomycetales bacterium]|nr:transcription-repair coupling factor [Planctomycetales bacterium]
LGTQQSGHIATVGYEMYCSMLEKAVRELRKLPPKESVDVTIDLPVEAFLPGSYVPDVRSKIDLYRRLARASSLPEVEDFAGELADRFGQPPPPVERMLELARLRVAAHQWGVQTIRREDSYLVLEYTLRHKMRDLVEQSHGRLRIADHRSADLPIPRGEDGVEALLAQVKSLLHPGKSAA